MYERQPTLSAGAARPSWFDVMSPRTCHGPKIGAPAGEANAHLLILSGVRWRLTMMEIGQNGRSIPEGKPHLGVVHS